MILQKDEVSTWTTNLKDFEPEYKFVKCWTVIQLFRLKGRTTNMCAKNVEPIPDMHYCIHDKYENKYFFREYRGYDLETLFLYRPTLTFSGESEPVANLRRYVQDNALYLLFTPEQIADTSAMLERQWKSHFVTSGKLDYRIFIELLKLSLEYEDYQDYGKSLTGYLTLCAKYERTIKELWDKAYNKKGPD